MSWFRRRNRVWAERDAHNTRTKGFSLAIDDPAGCPDCVDKDEQIADLRSTLTKAQAQRDRLSVQNTELSMVNARLRQALAEAMLANPEFNRAHLLASGATDVKDLPEVDRG